MSIITSVRVSLVATLLTAALGVTSARAQAQAFVPPAPPAPPAWPTLSVPPFDLDLDFAFEPPVPPTPPAVWALPAPPNPPAWPVLPKWPALSVAPPPPALPAMPPVALQVKPRPAPVVKIRGDVARADLYEQARNLIEQEQYAKALGQLDRLIALFDGKSIAESTANRVDAALYWKAYAQTKQRQLTDAMVTLQEIQKKFVESRWLKDAKALELEVRQASGQAVSPDSQTDDDLKLLALRGLMQSDPERGVPMIEQVLSGNSSLKVKENALFVLSQSRSSRAHEILGSVAKGGANPDLQLKAIRYLGTMGGSDNAQILEDAYRATSDEAVKRAIMRSFMISGNRARLAAIANEANNSVALRGEAIQQLGVMRADDELARMYGRESSTELKRRIIQGLFVSRSAVRLVELAKAEKDLSLKKDIVQKLSLMKSKEATDYLLELLK